MSLRHILRPAARCAFRASRAHPAVCARILVTRTVLRRSAPFFSGKERSVHNLLHFDPPPPEEIITAKAPFRVTRGTPVRVHSPDSDPVIDRDFGEEGLIGIVKADADEGETVTIVVVGDVDVPVTGILSPRVTVWPSKEGADAPLSGITCDLGDVTPPASLKNFAGIRGPPVGMIVGRPASTPNPGTPRGTIPLEFGLQEVTVRVPPPILFSPPPPTLERLKRFVPLAVRPTAALHMKSEIYLTRVVIASSLLLSLSSVTTVVVVLASAVPFSVMSTTFRDCLDPSWQQMVLDGLVAGARVALFVHILSLLVVVIYTSMKGEGGPADAIPAAVGEHMSTTGALFLLGVGALMSVASMAGSGRFRRTWRKLTTAATAGRYSKNALKGPFELVSGEAAK